MEQPHHFFKRCLVFPNFFGAREPEGNAPLVELLFQMAGDDFAEAAFRWSRSQYG